MDGWAGSLRLDFLLSVLKLLWFEPHSQKQSIQPTNVHVRKSRCNRRAQGGSGIVHTQGNDGFPEGNVSFRAVRPNSTAHLVAAFLPHAFPIL